MKEFLKRSWFVVLIGAILLGIAGYMTFDFMSQQLPSKKSDGRDVVFSYGDTDFTSDEMYELLYTDHGLNTIINYIELYVYRNAFEPDADLLSEAKIQERTTIQNLQYQYGEDYKDIISDAMISLGYSGDENSLLEYYITMLMRQEVHRNFIIENLEEYYPKYAQERNPRKISHILIMMEDPSNPTEEESAKLEEVKALLAKEGAVFSEIASQYSDDTGSAVNGGSLGVVDTGTISNFVENFKNSVYTVGAGEMTDWFATEYGYHIIFVDSDDPMDFIDEDAFIDQILSFYPNLIKKISWTEIEKQEISFSSNEEMETEIKKYYEVEIDTTVQPNGTTGGNGE